MKALLFLTLVVSLLPAESLEVRIRDLREGAHLSVPAEDRLLVGSSQSRAAALLADGVLSHQDSQGRGAGLQLTTMGYPLGEFGEILGAGPSLEAVWKAWLASPTHRAVLESPGWTRWGGGRATEGGVTVWVVRFWKP